MRKAWEQWQIDYVYNNYYKGNIKEIAAYIGKSPNALRNYAYSHNLYNGRYFTEQQRKIVEEKYGMIPLSELSEEIGKTEEQIKIFVAHNKIRSAKLWTKEQEEWLKENYGIYTAESCGKHLNRTTHAVTGKAQRMGIGQFAMNTEHMNETAVAEVLGVNKTTVSSWVRNGLIKAIRKKGMVLIPEKELLKFMQENPKRWSALKCDKYTFQRHKWFMDRLEQERNEMIEKRWGKWLKP